MSYLDRFDEWIPSDADGLSTCELMDPRIPLMRNNEPPVVPQNPPEPDSARWTFRGLLAAGAAAALIHLTRGRLKKPRTLKRTVLAVGAHPDDVEFGCGAALLRYQADGYEIRAIVLSNGENGLRTKSRAAAVTRRNEAMRAGSLLHLDSLRVFDFPDTRLFFRREQVKRVIEEEILRSQPDIIFTHCLSDLHSDHRMVHSATIEASRHVPTVLCYENPNTPTSFRPNVFIDVAPYLGKKIDALKCHASQARKPYFQPELIRSIARMRGNQAHVRFAEGFEAVRVRSGAM